MNIVSKTIYKKRFFGYYFVRGLVMIADAIITWIVVLFHYESDLYIHFCEWNIKQDIKRMKRKRNEKRIG
jgi:hypothetical protein